MASWKEQIAAAHAEVINEIKKEFGGIKGGPSITESVKAFCAAIDWSEPWIIALLTIQALVFITAVFSRKKPKLQAAIFFTSMTLVYSAERINTAASRNWKSFSKQNYFQGHGLFTSVLLSAPLLLSMFAILINYLWEMGILLVEMKKKELLYKERQRRKQEEQGNNSDTKKTN